MEEDHLKGCLESGQTRISESVLLSPVPASFKSALLTLTIFIRLFLLCEFLQAEIEDLTRRDLNDDVVQYNNQYSS